MYKQIFVAGAPLPGVYNRRMIACAFSVVET